MKVALIASGLLIEVACIAYFIALAWLPAPWPSTAAVIVSSVTVAVGTFTIANTP